MTTFIRTNSTRRVLCVSHKDFESVLELKLYLDQTTGIPLDSYFLTCNGSIVEDEDPVQEHVVYHTHLKILGGKGGFGSMLRAIGAQIEKTTNHEACRDLSGRRMRDVNYEKDLKEWAAKKAEKEREKEQKRQERIARRRAMPNHKFDDPLYEKQRELLSENQEDALQKGLQRAVAGPSTEPIPGKRKIETVTSADVKRKKATEWLGVDMDMSDLDSEEDESDSTDELKPAGATNGKLSSVEEQVQNVVLHSEPNESQTTDETSDKIISENEVDSVVKTDAVNLSHDSNICSDNATAKEEDLKKEADNLESVESVSLIASENKNDSGDENLENEDKETNQGKKFCLEEMEDIDQVLSFGMDILKEELMSRGLKCGGTLEQRALRLFSVKGLALDEIDPALFAKSIGKNGKSNGKKK